MPDELVCPTCRTPHRGPASPGATVVCAQCMEEFTSGSAKLAEVLSLDDDTPAQPRAKPVAKGKPVGPKKKTGNTASATGRVAGAPKTRRRDDDDDDDEPRRRRRGAPAPSGPSAGVWVGIAVAVLFVIGVLVGIGSAVKRAADRIQAQNQAAQDSLVITPPEVNRPTVPKVVVPPVDPIWPAPPAIPPNPGVGGAPVGADPFAGVVDGALPPGPGIGGGAPAGPPAKPAKPEPPPEPVGPPLPPFDEPANPFPAGTQTKLRELASVKLPAVGPPPKDAWRGNPNDHAQLVFSPKHKLLFARSGAAVTVYDATTGKTLATQKPTHTFFDMSLSPDQSALFVADYGGENTGYGTPLKPHRVHRFDLAARTWEDRTAPKIAARIEAVDSLRVLLLEQDQWVAVSLNAWETDGVGLRELSRTGSDYNGDIEYDPRTGRIYHGNRGISSPRISVRALDGNKLKALGDTGSYGSASTGGGGGTVVLSQDGSRLYYGALQVNAAEVGKNLQKFPELVYAASRDIAFGPKAYYRATTGSKLGEWPFKTVAEERNSPFGGGPPVMSVSPDGMSVWVLDRDTNTARQFAIEGGK